MEREILDFWGGQAGMGGADDVAALRQVLDPNDVKGVKNSYIDAYLKYYVREFLQPEAQDTLLEIGCGIGRLTEYLAQFVRAAYGTDVIAGFIDGCRANERKAENTFYFTAGDLPALLPVNKMYVVWVLMYVRERNELVEMLTDYRDRLPHLESVTIVEQVKRQSQAEYHDGAAYCFYRTIEEYIEIFRESGFAVREVAVLGERYHGMFYRLLHVMGNMLPKRLARRSEALFHVDRMFMSDAQARKKLVNDRRPTDVVFQLHVA